MFHYQPWSNSPFAWDVPYDNDTDYTLPYVETSSYSFYINATYNTSTVIGGVCSFTLLYLVLYHSKGSLKHYSNVMLLCCVNDLNYWLFDHLGHLQTTSRDGVFMAKLNGLARYFDWKVQVIIFSLIVNATILSNTILPAQAYCRYYALKYDTPMTKWHTFRVFCYALSAGIPIFIASFLSCYYSPTSRPGLNYGQFWFHERPLPIVMYTDIRHVTQICYFLLGTIVVTIAYSLAVWYSYKTYLYLEENKSGYTAKTRKVNKQLSICMLCQAIVSLTVACGPIMVFTVPTFLHADSGISTWICGVILSLVPICNPIVTVVIIKPYRNTLLKAFGLQKRNLIEDSSSGSYAI